MVAFHDDRLDRVTDRRGLVAELSWAEVAAARVGGSEPVVRLDDLLATFPAARVNIDAKHDAVVDPLVRVLRAHRALERVCIGSFSDARILAIRMELGPDACTSLAQGEVAALRLGSWGLRSFAATAGRRGAACVQVPSRLGPLPVVDRRFVATAHRLGLPVHVWTVDDAEEMTSLLDLGVDGLMTDRPVVLRSVLESRGAWTGTIGS